MNTNKTLATILVIVVAVLIAAAIAYLAARPVAAPTPNEPGEALDGEVPRDEADEGELNGEVMNDGGTNGGNAPNAALAAYFQERMNTAGIEALDAMPIEGFDADLLMGAFPGLTAADFNGVATFEGRYELRSGTLTFIRDEPQPVSSAERTVSAEGYATLLANVADRLQISVDSTTDVDALIQRLG